jgi:hypothetical protein
MSVLVSKTKGQFAPISRRHARAVSKRNQGGTVLFHAFPSGFSAARPSFYGFRQHMGGAGVAAQPINPPGLTRYPAMGENWALKLSTPDLPLASIPANQRSYAVYKNLSRHFKATEAGLISFSGYFASMAGREAPGGNWAIGIDAQTWGNTDRSFFKAECHYSSGTGGAQWYLVDNEGAAIAILPTNASARHTAGINQNKANFNYIELTVKLNANGERGQYYSLQINDLFFDLTNVENWADPTQSGKQAPQGSESDPTTSAAHLLNYSGGLNFGIFGSASVAEGSHPTRLICVDLMATVFDA